MKYELILHWCECDKEFHYELWVNGYWICAFCSLEVIYQKLKKEWWNIKRL